MGEILSGKIKEKGLIDKSDISEFIDDSDKNKKIAALATKGELKANRDKVMKFKAFDSSHIRGKYQNENDGTQKYLVKNFFNQCIKF